MTHSLDAGDGSPVHRRRHALRGWRGKATAAFYVLYLGGIATLMIGAFLHQGLQYNAMRNAPGATHVTLTVTDVVPHCSKGCTYKSVGTYVDPATHELVNNVVAVPNFSEPANGPLQVIVSPSHRFDAIRADYTGTGDIVAGCVFLAGFALVPLTLLGAWLEWRHRRARMRSTMADVNAGTAEPTGRFDGILRGPGISTVIGISSIEPTTTELIEYESHVSGAARWQVALIDVTDVEENARVSLDAPIRMNWRSLRFHTAAGSFTLTCDPMYFPLVVEAFRRHAPAAEPATTDQSGNVAG